MCYWKNRNETLEEAQQNKIDHIIKKLVQKAANVFLMSAVAGEAHY